MFDSLDGQDHCKIVSVIAFTALILSELRFTIFITEHKRSLP